MIVVVVALVMLVMVILSDCRGNDGDTVYCDGNGNNGVDCGGGIDDEENVADTV